MTCFIQVLLTNQGSDLVSKLLKMQQLEDEEELAYNAAAADHDVVAGIIQKNILNYFENICMYHIIVVPRYSGQHINLPQCVKISQ